MSVRSGISARVGFVVCPGMMEALSLLRFCCSGAVVGKAKSGTQGIACAKSKFLVLDYPDWSWLG